MSVSSVSSSSTYAPVNWSRAESDEVQRAGRVARSEGGSDAPAVSVAAQVSTAAPMVNLEGQTIGSRINVSA